MLRSFFYCNAARRRHRYAVSYQCLGHCIHPTRIFSGQTFWLLNPWRWEQVPTLPHPRWANTSSIPWQKPQISYIRAVFIHTPKTIHLFAVLYCDSEYSFNSTILNLFKQKKTRARKHKIILHTRHVKLTDACGLWLTKRWAWTAKF
jgi:hypothetical protein